MTILDEALAQVGPWTPEQRMAVEAAARNWHALTTGESAERIGQAIRDNESVWMRETAESYFVNTDALARIAVDALTVTAEEEKPA